MARAGLTQRGKQTRERIVDTAADLVYARGAGVTSLDDVLAATRTSKSQLYHYFDGKEGLLRAVIASQAARVQDFHRELLRPVRTLADLRGWAVATVSAAERSGLGGCPLGSLANELADVSSTYRRELVRGFDGWQDLLEDAVVRLQEAGEARTDVPAAELAANVLAALEGGLLLARTRRDPGCLSRALDMAIAHLTRDDWTARATV